MDWAPLQLTFYLAAVTTLILFFIAVPIAYWLSFHRNRWSPVLETVISLPLVLPPTVIGFYLLIAFSPESGLGGFLNDWLGLQLVFSFPGLVLGSIIYSLPFMVQPIRSGLMNLPESMLHAAKLMDRSRWMILSKVLLPSIRPSIITALVLSFAHTVGEFGVVLMIGGNIPGSTRVASIAIYDEVEKLNYQGAHFYSAILALITFGVLLLAFSFQNGKLRKWWT